MSYTDLYLKFASEAEMRSVLFEQVPTAWDNTDPDGEPIPIEFEDRQLYRNTDIVGLIVDTPAELNEEGEVTSEATFLDGIHVNIRLMPGESAEGLSDYLCDPTPATPERVWA
tara:strand:+ start:15 stop:353 length:339 start_codon:yes stop_codon:yes gene_type:complete